MSVYHDDFRDTHMESVLQDLNVPMNNISRHVATWCCFRRCCIFLFLPIIVYATLWYDPFCRKDMLDLLAC